jgi:nitrogen fixation/metabolism regulation signal transduction histidine kinase
MNANRIIVYGLVCATLGAGLVWISAAGLQATQLLLGLLLVAVLWLMRQMLLQQQQLPEQLFRALANGDHSLGLAAEHPLQQHFEQARLRMQQARLSSESQLQFLRQVLWQLELALLICTEDGQISEQSPATARLLGFKPQSLAQLQPTLSAFIQQVQTGTARGSCPWQRGEQPDTLSVLVSCVVIAGAPMKIVTLQSVQQLLNLREQQAYSRLTRVLTHEVANSITPLSSLAQSCLSLMPADLCFDSAEDKADLQLALTTLSTRTHHLGAFIQDFRQVAALPMPQLQPVQLSTLLQQVLQLFSAELAQKQIQCQSVIEQDWTVLLDAGQIEQVLINVLKNAIEALQQQPRSQAQQPAQIWLTLCAPQDGQLQLDVRDNGPGISPTAAALIFVPFFTTKRQGSGIGLALARQIMLNHGGDLLTVPTANGACFRIIFG